MSARCKVCNALRVANTDNTNDNWECQTCGNLIDIHGNVIVA